MDERPTFAADGFDVARAAALMLAQGHAGWLGLRYHAHGPDWAELELPWRADLIGEEERQVLASGPLVSLMDMASGMRVWIKMGAFKAIAKRDLRVNYVSTARTGNAVKGRVK